MNKCKICYKSNHAEAKFCRFCGSSLSAISEDNKMPVWAKIILIFLGIGVFIIILGLISNLFGGNLKSQDTYVKPPVQVNTNQNKIISYSFNDFAILCDTKATSLQKENYFNSKFKDEYVEWTGTVSYISKTLGMYILQVKQCPYTFTSDVQIKMNSDQESKLLKFREGDTIKYRAKLIDIGDFVGISATEGVVL